MNKHILSMLVIWALLVVGCQPGQPVVSTSRSQSVAEEPPSPVAYLDKSGKNSEPASGQNKIKVLYAGDSGIVMGPHIIASPFNYESKGAEVHVWCQQVLDALNAQPDIEVRYMTTWEAFEEFPETPEELAQYDVVVISDIEWEVLVLYPWSRFMDAPMGPNRLVSIRDYVKNGGSLLMIGGWSSFTGRKGIGGYHGTPVEEALPVECLDINDDRREAPEGVHIITLKPDHPIMQGLRWETCEVFTGYNRLKAKSGSKVIAQVKEFGDPFLVVGEYGEGKSMAFASDIAPHWGSGFMKWDGYDRFWVQAIRWLGKK